MPDDKSSAPVPDIALQTIALTRTFGDLTAVDGATLTINQGEIFGLIPAKGATYKRGIYLVAGGSY